MIQLLDSLSSFVLWAGFILIFLLCVYMKLLLRKKRASYKRLKDELGYPMPPIPNQLYGHLDEIASKENEFKWHKQFGKVFGFYYCDMPQLRISDIDLINEVFLKQNKLFNARSWSEWRLTPVLSSILFNKGQKWKKTRKILQPALSEYRLKKDDSSTTIHDIQCGLEKLIKHFKLLIKHPNLDQEDKFPEEDDENAIKQPDNQKQASKETTRSQYSTKGFMPIEYEASSTGWAIDLDAYQVMQVITLDVIFRIGFNKETVDVLKGASDPSLKVVKLLLNSVNNLIYKIAIAIPLARPFIFLYIILFDKNRRTYRRFVNELVSSDSQETNQNEPVNQEEAGPRRIFHVLMDEYRAGRLKWRHVISNSFAILVAGFETTATTSAYILWCIAKHNECRKKLQIDLQSYGVESKYLDMFIKEVMRMYPALPNFVIRTPSENTKLNGYTVKRGMSIYMSVNSIHHDETIWEDPYTFNPERFEEGNTYPPGAYAPFGLGHRMCAGYQLALREMKTIVSELLINFDIQLVAPTEMVTESSTIFLTRPKQDIRLRLIPVVHKTIASPTADSL